MAAIASEETKSWQEIIIIIEWYPFSVKGQSRLEPQTLTRLSSMEGALQIRYFNAVIDGILIAYADINPTDTP